MLTAEQQQAENAMQSQIQAQLRAYYSTRSEDDIDLVGSVATLLSTHALGHRVQEFLSDPLIAESADKASHVQRFNLNRYFGMQLLRVEGQSTLDERYCLIPNGEVKEWLNLFAAKVLPTLVAHDLPRAY